MPTGLEALSNNSIHTRLFGFHRKAGRTDHMHHCHSPALSAIPSIWQGFRRK